MLAGCVLRSADQASFRVFTFSLSMDEREKRASEWGEPVRKFAVSLSARRTQGLRRLANNTPGA
ncbi:MAG TPA: hypothetical protein VHK24_04865 [Steroidobacter sp.]|nr:hypothetical protein [Steroidobacter sp.]